MSSASQKKGKIAIVGGGISGLTAGWLLSRKGDYDVTLYEAMNHNGLDGYAMDVPINHPVFKNSKPLHIDVPFRYHVPNIYSNLTQMCKVLGVKTQQYDQDIILYNNIGNFLMGYSTYHMGSYSLPVPYFRNFITPEFYQYLWQFFWFRKNSWKDWQQGKLKGKTFIQYLNEQKISGSFVENFLLNYLSLVHTCTFDTLKQYPAEILVKFLHDMTSGYGLWRFTYGTKDVAERLLKPFQLCSGTRIAKIELVPNGVKLFFPDGKFEVFDDVVIATQPNVAVKIIESVAELTEQKAELSKFPVVQSTMSIHTDLAVFPTQDEPSSKNVLQAKILNKNYVELAYLKNPTVIQTWSMDKSPADPKTVLAETRMNRQIHTLSSLGAADKIVSLQGKNHIWFCGGYTLKTIPLLESGVVAACNIAKKFGCEIPWNLVQPRTPGPVPKSNRQFAFELFGFFFVLYLAFRIFA